MGRKYLGKIVKTPTWDGWGGHVCSIIRSPYIPTCSLSKRRKIERVEFYKTGRKGCQTFDSVEITKNTRISLDTVVLESGW